MGQEREEGRNGVGGEKEGLVLGGAALKVPEVISSLEEQWWSPSLC